MTLLQSTFTTLVALTIIAIAGAGWLTGHCTFDQFISAAGATGTITGGLHFIASPQPAVQQLEAAPTGPPAAPPATG